MKRIKTESRTGVLANDRTGQIKLNLGKSRLIKVVFLKLSLKDKTEGRAATSRVDEGGRREFWVGLTNLKMKTAAPGAGALRCL